MNRRLKIFFRCHPETPLATLKDLTNKKDLVLWAHGGKFTPEETTSLVTKANKAGLLVALDLGQKTRVEEIHQPEDVKGSGLGREIEVGSMIVLAEKNVYKNQLMKCKDDWPEAILAKVNRLPKIETEFGLETKINFGEDEVICRINQDRSVEKGHIFLEVVETHLGKIFADHSIVGGKYSLEESRDSLLGDKDIKHLEMCNPEEIQYLILSFVLDSSSVASALVQIDRLWPNWRKKASNHIVLKIETAKAVENIEDILSLDDGKTIYMVGLGDLSTSAKYRGWKMETVLDKLLTTFDQHKKPVIIASYICLPLLPPDAYEVLEWPKDKLAWLQQILAKHLSVFAIGTTSESIRASQRGVLKEFLKKAQV